MSKLNYPANGLYPLSKGSIEACSTDLVNAISNCNFDIPSGFSQAAYLNSLGGRLNGYLQEVKNISSKIQKTDRNFQSFSDNAESGADRIIIERITKRVRMAV